MEKTNVCQLFNKKVFIALFLVSIFGFLGCHSNPILNSRLSLTPEEQKRLMGAVDRKSNSELYESNFSHVVHPNTEMLFKEANFVDLKNFESNYSVLIDWYSNKLSKKNLIQLENNCAMMVGQFSEQFPLIERSLPCVGWWLEKKAYVRKRIAKETELSNKKFRSFTILSKKDRLVWTKYKDFELSDVLKNINELNFEDTSQLTKKAVTDKRNCHYKNAYAALIFKLEDFLSKENTYQKIEKIYHHAAACYVATETITERVNSRIGVLGLVQKDYELASKVFKKNHSVLSPQDGSRNLFWLGLIEHKKNNSTNNIYWEQLIRENPFGFFSIIAHDKMNRDPMDTFVSDDAIPIQNRIVGGWNDNNLQSFIFDLFYSKKEYRVLNNVASNSLGNFSALNKDLYLYWAVNHNLIKNDRGTIYMLSKYFDSQKEPRISTGLLTLNFPTRYSEEILSMSEKIDPLLILALIRQESAFDSKAVSSADARGLMQLLPSTARTLQKNIQSKNLFEPKTNIKLGIMYLEKLFQRYNGRTEYVLAAYNAGPLRVDAWSQRLSSDTMPLLFMEYVPFRETRNYVSAIMRNYYWYKRLLNDQKNDQIARLYLEKNMASIWKPTNIIAMFDDYKHEHN